MSDNDESPIDPSAELRKQQIGDIRSLLGVPAARRLICRILERTGPLRQTMALDSERASFMASGEQNVGRWLLSEISDAYPEAVGGILTDMQNPNRVDKQKG